MCILHDVNLFQYLKAQQKGLDIILDGDKWFNTKKPKELWGTTYKIIEKVVTVG
jgi:hypothetical protein